MRIAKYFIKTFVIALLRKTKENVFLIYLNKYAVM